MSSKSFLLYFMYKMYLIDRCAESNNIFIADVDDVKFVVNYDFPQCSEDYVHRYGY